MKNSISFKALLFAIALINFGISKAALKQQQLSSGKTYYFNTSGKDKNKGTKDSPWRTIKKLNRIQLQPRDSVLFQGGQTFAGTIKINLLNSGSEVNPVTITSYGNGNAIINGGYRSAIEISNSQYLSVKNLNLIGAGRKDGNVEEGISISNSKNITISSLDISGFQKAGLFIYSCDGVSATHIYAHENGASGIGVDGIYGQKNCRNIYLGYCRAMNNPGDPSNLTNHSGNGIIVGHCTKVIVEYCEATYNGWDMPRTGNGPVGIWGYEADSLIIQHCLSYHNKTSRGGQDGGGFDLDGGVTNSIVQYCLSYENQGAGYGIFQYAGASPWYNNIFRYNISKDDGLVSSARAGIYIWNSTGTESQFYNCLFYNNTIYNTKGAAINYSSTSKRKNFSFYNNIFQTESNFIKGERAADTYIANNWWNAAGQIINENIYRFAGAGKENKQEIINENIAELNIDPEFNDPNGSMPTSSSTFKSFDKFYIPENSSLLNNGLDLHLLLGIETGNLDFNVQPAPLKGIGACFNTYNKSAHRPACIDENSSKTQQALDSQLIP